MDAVQIEIIKALGSVNFQFGGWGARFIKDLSFEAKHNPVYILTEKQNEWMYRLLYKYRRQCKAIYNKHKENPLCSKKINVINIAQ